MKYYLILNSQTQEILGIPNPTQADIQTYEDIIRLSNGVLDFFGWETEEDKPTGCSDDPDLWDESFEEYDSDWWDDCPEANPDFWYREEQAI